MLLKACNKIWVSMLIKSQEKPLAFQKKVHENTQTYFWQLNSLAQQKNNGTTLYQYNDETRIFF